MAEEAAPKKKKGCLGLIVKTSLGLTAAGILLAILSTMHTAGQIKGCNEGKAEDCESLLARDFIVDEDFDLDQITNEEYKPKFVAQVEAAKKAAAERKAEAGMANALVQAMAACQNSLKAAMKDPDSFQVHNRDFATLQIEYSATNSFGGRIRNVMDCRTGKNLR